MTEARRTICVRDLMRPVEEDDVPTGLTKYCFQDQAAGLVAEYMEEQGVKQLLVLDQDARVVGVLLRQDVSAGLPASVPEVGMPARAEAPQPEP